MHVMDKSHFGVLKCLARGGGFLRNPVNSYRPEHSDPWVAPEMIRDHKLVDGAGITGRIKRSQKGWQLDYIEQICGVAPEVFRSRIGFDRLPAIDPQIRIPLGAGGNRSMRIIELIAPIGKGTRGLIVAPPKSGKTQLLEEMAIAIHAVEPDCRIIVMLIDERPEEVTHFRKQVPAEVLASSSDQDLDSHVNLAELALAHIRCELECGRDVIVLVDSITRLARAFNRYGSSSGRTLSGGLDARAMEIPRRFFGLARNIENGGSVTVIATAQVDTGSRMDNYIFEEFKSTGNSEIVLDRSMAEARIFPAINLLASGTRKEEKLYGAVEINRLAALRRWLVQYDHKEAMRNLLRLIESTKTNKEVLEKLDLIQTG